MDKSDLTTFYRKKQKIQLEFGVLAKSEKCSFGQTNFGYENVEELLQRMRSLMKVHSLVYDIAINDYKDGNIWNATLTIYDLETEFLFTQKYAGVGDSKLPNKIQGWGATNTYIQRYILKYFFGIGQQEIDPDSNEHHKRSTPKRKLISPEQLKELTTALETSGKMKGALQYISDNYGLGTFKDLDTDQFKTMIKKAK